MQNKIQMIRWDLKISLPEFSKKSGISTTTIWRIENGLVSPSLFAAHRICKALGKTIYEVFILD